MKICVLIKPVIDPTSLQWDYKNKEYGFVTHGFHHADLCALQWACDYKRQYAGHITVLLAMDADEAFREQMITKHEIDECIVMKVKDLHLYRNEVAFLLAKESGQRQFDLILCGSQSQDTNLGITPIIYAELLKLPYLSHIHHIEPEEGNVWKVQRKEGRGLVQTFQIELPAVIGVVSAIARKRYVARFAQLQRRTKPFFVQVARKIDQSPQVKVVKVTEPKPKIRYFDVPSPRLSAEKRLLEIMGFTQASKIERKEKSVQQLSEQTIHYMKEKLQKWLGEG